MLKDLVRALSLANLCFIITWNDLLNSPIRRFNTCLAIIICVMLLGTLFWIAITLARRSERPLAMRLARFFFPLVVLLPLNGLDQVLVPKQKLLGEIIILVIGIAVVGLFEIMPWHRIIVRTSAIVILVLSPFFLITMSQVFRSLTRVPHSSVARSSIVRNASVPRVLWLLFDGMDQQVVFSNRPATLQLPELDRLCSEALYATNTYPPSDSTLVSVPALIMGKLLSNTELINQSKLMITLADSKEPVSWNSQPNLFSEARKSGVNTALIGWYIPFCDILGEDLTSCSWVDADAAKLGESTSEQIDSLISTIPLASGFGVINLERREKNHRKRIVESYIGVLDAAKKAAADPNLGLILVHWPVPHPPNIYNRFKDQFETDGNSSYVDNLRLVDSTLQELRQVMEESGTWQDTTILLTSDHWWRTFIWRSIGPWTDEDAATFKDEADHRVPFILKLAGQKSMVTYDPVFNNVLTHDLILALLHSELSSPDSVVHWLDQHRSIGESPYRFNLPE